MLEGRLSHDLSSKFVYALSSFLIILYISTFVVAGTQQHPAAVQEASSGAQSHLSMLST